jgi:hypothetical protein
MEVLAKWGAARGISAEAALLVYSKSAKTKAAVDKLMAAEASSSSVSVPKAHIKEDIKEEDRIIDIAERMKRDDKAALKAGADGYTVAEYGGEGTGDWAVLQHGSNVWIFPAGEETNATREQAEAKAAELRKTIKAADLADIAIASTEEGRQAAEDAIRKAEKAKAALAANGLGEQASDALFDAEDAASRAEARFKDGRELSDAVLATLFRKPDAMDSYWAVTAADGQVLARITLGALSGGKLNQSLVIAGKKTDLYAHLSTTWGMDLADHVAKRGRAAVLAELKDAQQTWELEGTRKCSLCQMTLADTSEDGFLKHLEDEHTGDEPTMRRLGPGRALDKVADDHETHRAGIKANEDLTPLLDAYLAARDAREADPDNEELEKNYLAAQSAYRMAKAESEKRFFEDLNKARAQFDDALLGPKRLKAALLEIMAELPANAVRDMGWDGEYVLMHEDGGYARKGEELTNFLGEKGVLEDGEAPRKSGSQGKVYTNPGGRAYASVYGLKWSKLPDGGGAEDDVVPPTAQDILDRPAAPEGTRSHRPKNMTPAAKRFTDLPTIKASDDADIEELFLGDVVEINYVPSRADREMGSEPYQGPATVAGKEQSRYSDDITYKFSIPGSDDDDLLFTLDDVVSLITPSPRRKTARKMVLPDLDRSKCNYEQGWDELPKLGLNDVEEVRDYSGRGMYGEMSPFAFTVRNPTDAQDRKLTEWGLRRDNLGHKTIYYQEYAPKKKRGVRSARRYTDLPGGPMPAAKPNATADLAIPKTSDPSIPPQPSNGGR